MISMVYVPFPSEDIASEVVQKVLEQKLAACANIFCTKSQYYWNEAYVSENEWVAIFKTTAIALKRLVEEVQRLHPYETPAIIHYEAQANVDYEAWVHGQVQVAL